METQLPSLETEEQTTRAAHRAHVGSGARVGEI